MGFSSFLITGGSWDGEKIVYDGITARFIIIDTDGLLKLLDEHKSGAKNNQRKIWTVWTFLVWHRIFIENNGRI